MVVVVRILVPVVLRWVMWEVVCADWLGQRENALLNCADRRLRRPR